MTLHYEKNIFDWSPWQVQYPILLIGRDKIQYSHFDLTDKDECTYTKHRSSHVWSNVFIARLVFVELCYATNGGVRKGYLEPYFLCQPLNSGIKNWEASVRPNP